MASTPHPRNARAGRGIAAWLIPPASGWQRKATGLKASRAFLLLVGLGMGLLALAGLALWAAAAGTVPGWFFPVQAGLATALLGLGVVTALWIRHELLVPLTHLRNWALRVRGGNLAARIPITDKGEFAQLASDINGLADELQSLSRNMQSKVAKQTRRIEHKTRSLQVLYDVATAINSSRSVDELLTRFLHRLKEVVRARAGLVRLITEDGRMPLIASTGLEDAVVERERHLPAPGCMCRKAAMEGHFLCRSDLARCEETVGQPLLEGSSVGLIAVPLLYRGRTLGVYNLFVEDESVQGLEDLRELLTSVGRHLGMAVAKARLDEEANRLSIMEERTHIAHELHDSLAQTIASLRFQVKVLEETAPEKDPRGMEGELHQIAENLDDAHTELRELISHFRAPVADQDLVKCMHNLVDRFQRQTGTTTYLQNEWGECELPVTVTSELMRIVQEALCNIRKHADANTVRIILRSNSNGAHHILIEDDGEGIVGEPGEGTQGEHVGLSVMKERAERIGATLRIDSEPGEGTSVSLTLSPPTEAQEIPLHRHQAVS